MDMSHDSGGYGLGFPYHYIIGTIILFFVVWLIVAMIKRKKRREQ